MVSKLFTNITKSFAAFFAGIDFCSKNKWVFKYLIKAVIFNLIVYVFLAILLFLLAKNIVDTGLDSFLENSYYDQLSWLFATVIWLLFIYLLNLSFSVLSTIINAPIYADLTVRIQETQIKSKSSQKTHPFAEIISATSFEIKKIILFLIIFGPLFLLNFIPIIGSFAYSVIATIGVLIFLGIDSFEPYHSGDNLSFLARIKDVFKNFDLYIPFLLLSGLLINIPVANLLIAPISVVGAGFLYNPKVVS